MTLRTMVILVAMVWLACPVQGADQPLLERARLVMADRQADPGPHGQRLTLYADSLRTLDVVLATRCLELSGIAAFRSNNLDSALVRWRRGVSWAQQAGEKKSESSLLNALAIGYTAQGNVETALPVYDRALEIREALADTMGLCRTWGNLAQAYANMGRTAEALSATEEGGKWLALVDSPKSRLANVLRTAQILGTMGRLEEALLQTEKAVQLASGFEDDVRAMASMKYGNSLLDLGRTDESLPWLRESVDLFRSSGDDYNATFAEQSIVMNLLQLNRPEEALTSVRAVIPEVEAAGQIPLLTVLRRYEGSALLDLGRVAEAESTLIDALALFEERRNSLTDDRSRSGIFSASGELYASLARCQLATQNPEAAFATVERGRGAIFRDHGTNSVARIDDLQRHLQNNNAALILFNDPVYDPLVAFVLDGTSLHTVDLGSPRFLAADAKTALRLLAAGESLETCGPALARLEESLAIPILAQVDSGVQRFSVVPPSFLAGFPLGILRDSQGNRWGDTRPLSYWPNATAMLELEARVVPQKGVLALADPATGDEISSRLPTSSARAQAGVPLPEARTEIKAVAWKESQRRVGTEASGHLLRQALSTSLAVLHLATHAVVDPVDGGRSAVVLAGDDGIDVVTALEISAFDFQGDLVVLSGCSTFGEHRVLGEGWFGLPRSFLEAGARTVISTLWDVDDLGARTFITEFYTALRQGSARDEALVRAREICRRKGMPPREWAAFVLTGVGAESVNLLADSASESKSKKLLRVLAAILGAVLGIGLWLRGKY